MLNVQFEGITYSFQLNLGKTPDSFEANWWITLVRGNRPVWKLIGQASPFKLQARIENFRKGGGEGLVFAVHKGEGATFDLQSN
jgi:hypothetical protein